LICVSIIERDIIDWSFENKLGNEFNWGGVHILRIGKFIKYFKTGTFAKVTNVTKIDMSFNELESIDFNELANNPQLNALHLGYNKISKIKSIKNSTILNLTKLRLDDNDLTDISELCKLKKLEQLVLNLNGNENLNFNTTMLSIKKFILELKVLATLCKVHLKN
jgi:Leucine-rich repeat (LRR) protein